ncbi:MAG: MBL fold metallo-hydrolase [Clostridia bacterium]|nr:MBL fold metallo-hydrolase [Clostridia bacterium]
MAKIYFLGTCSGTEPMEGMHHSSLVIEAGGMLYWFDAGETCSHTAYRMGLDPLQTRAIFLSHMHIDHTGGLANLFFCIHKMISLGKGEAVADNTVDVISPDPDLVTAIKRVACNGRQADESLLFATEQSRTQDGVIYEDENLRVTALHNRHLREDGTNGWHSYSFRIEVDGRRVVHSGDVASVEELTDLLAGGCDLLLMETGHHKVREVCEFAKRHAIPRLRFIHHGREILNDRAAAQGLIDSYEMDVKLAYDGMTESI